MSLMFKKKYLRRSNLHQYSGTGVTNSSRTKLLDFPVFFSLSVHASALYELERELLEEILGRSRLLMESK
jgi:hypothetical protein